MPRRPAVAWRWNRRWRAPADGSDPFAFLLMDADLPEPGGFALAQRFAAEWPRPDRIIPMMASHSQRNDALRCEELGSATTSPSPSRPRDLLAVRIARGAASARLPSRRPSSSRSSCAAHGGDGAAGARARGIGGRGQPGQPDRGQGMLERRPQRDGGEQRRGGPRGDRQPSLRRGADGRRCR